MKKFTKIALIFAAVMVGIGVICLSAAVALGMNFQTFSDMVKEGRFHLDEDDIETLFQCYVKEDTLHIEGGKKLGVHKQNGKVTLVLPKGTKFEEADLSIGAGEAKLEGLAAEQVEIEVGAGEADIKNLDTSLLKAETGAGELSVELVGEESDYHYEAECGIGEIQIGERTFGGLGGKQNVQNPGAQRTLELECGVGEIRVAFEK